jgi:hypothetical protein
LALTFLPRSEFYITYAAETRSNCHSKLSFRRANRQLNKIN